MNKRRSVAFGAAVSFACCLTVACTPKSRESPERREAGDVVISSDNAVGYPLSGPLGAGWTARMPVGQKFGDGLLVVTNRGPNEVVIESVDPQIRGSQLLHIGTRIAGLTRKIGSIQQTTWPPQEPALGRTINARGAVLQPAWNDPYDIGYEVVIGYQVVDVGRATVPAVTIRYRDVKTGEKYHVAMRSTIAVCAGVPDTAPCEPEYGASS